MQSIDVFNVKNATQSTMLHAKKHLILICRDISDISGVLLIDQGHKLAFAKQLFLLF